MSLDIGLLISRAKERGELEGRVTTLIKEIKKSGNIILFIDEVHTLIGSGTVGRRNKGSGLDIANLLKPALGRGELQPSPRDLLVQCFIKRNSSTQTFYLYLSLSQVCFMDNGPGQAWDRPT